jgi:hypothetical protein
MATITPQTSRAFFALIDADGNKRIPQYVTAPDGRTGYALHPPGKGNDPGAADYLEDEKAMIQAVVLHGAAIRARAEGGRLDGQVNTVSFSGKSKMAGYWLCASRWDWVKGSKMRPVNEAARR